MEKKFNPEDFIFAFHKELTFFLAGIIFLGIGIIVYNSSGYFFPGKVEIIESSESNNDLTVQKLTVEISGGVQKSGVYRMDFNARVDDLIIMSGGLSYDADRGWIDRNLNRAARLSDGQKIYIPRVSDNEVVTSNNISKSAENVAGISSTSVLININTASKAVLESLPGIGPVYAQNIIDKRIYSNTDELLSRGVLKESTYRKIKDKVTVN